MLPQFIARAQLSPAVVRPGIGLQDQNGPGLCAEKSSGQGVGSMTQAPGDSASGQLVLEATSKVMQTSEKPGTETDIT